MFPGLHTTFAGQLAANCPGRMVTASVKLDLKELLFIGEAIDDNGTTHKGEPFAANEILVAALKEGEAGSFGEIEAIYFEYDHAKRIAVTTVKGTDKEGAPIVKETRETY